MVCLALLVEAIHPWSHELYLVLFLITGFPWDLVPCASLERRTIPAFGICFETWGGRGLGADLPPPPCPSLPYASWSCHLSLMLTAPLFPFAAGLKTPYGHRASWCDTAGAYTRQLGLTMLRCLRMSPTPAFMQVPGFLPFDGGSRGRCWSS